LLDHVPGEVDGLPVVFLAEESRDAARRLVGGPITSVASAVLGGIPQPDIAVVNVMRLANEGVDRSGFRDLRETFNDEVCREWGGVAGNAQAELEGRVVHIGSCAREGRTYHALLERSNTVVSVYAGGQKRLGELLMRELRDP
jgi:hypothetical protein